jgi:hypothetical protein
MSNASILFDFLKDTWTFLAGALIIIALLGMMGRTLQGTAALSFGASGQLSYVLTSTVSIFALTLFMLIFIPEIIRSVVQTQVDSAVLSCSYGSLAPVANKVIRFSLQLIVALSALRMLKSVLLAVVYNAFDASAKLAGSLIESAEVVAGVLLLSVIAPLVIKFFGVC